MCESRAPEPSDVAKEGSGDFDQGGHLDIGPFSAGTHDVTRLGNKNDSRDYAGHPFHRPAFAGVGVGVGGFSRFGREGCPQVGQMEEEDAVVEGHISLAPGLQRPIDARDVFSGQGRHVG